ncbi:RDD family protein [Streptomyces chattanoogensis]
MYDQSLPHQPHQQQPQNHHPQHPYQQQPYQQPTPQQAPLPQQHYAPQHSQQYAPHHAQQNAQQHPYQHPYQQPSPQQAMAARIPQPANDMRRIGAVTLDGLLTLTAAFVGLRISSGAHLPFSKDLLIVFGGGLGFSFLNHVILTRISGASIGKFATRTRVIYEKTGTRPYLTRLFRRWLGGLAFVVIWLIAALMDSADEGPDDFCGVRLVRYRDLRAATQIQGY